MGCIILVHLDADLSRTLRDGRLDLPGIELIELATPDLALQRLEGSGDFDALVLGASVVDPVRVAQLAHRVNRDVAIHILSPPDRIAGLSRAIQFAPFLGEDVTCRSLDDLYGLTQALHADAGRARRRTTHRATLDALSRRQARAAPPQAHVSQLLDRILEHAPIGVVTADLHGEILDANTQARRMLGALSGTPVGTRLVDLFPSQREQLVQYLDASRGGPAGAAPVVVTRSGADGSERAIEMMAAPVSSRTGDPGALVLMADVTARVRAERRRDDAERRLRFLADASRLLASSLDYDTTLVHVARLAAPFLADWCVVYLQDEDGQIRRVALETGSADSDDGRNRGSETSINPEARAGVPEVIRSGRPALHPDADTELLIADVDRPEVLRAIIEPLGVRSWMCVPMFANGQAIGAISFISTTPERRYGDDDLRVAEDLAQRAGFAIEHARLYQEVRDALRAREEFVSVAAHELRTPLTTIKAFGQLLERELRRIDALPDRVGGLTSSLQGQIDRLEALVEDLLDASRLGQQLELRREPLDLVALSRQVLERFEPDPSRTIEHAIVLDAPAPVIGAWDASRLDQAITNLVSNALKYSPAGGEVRLTVRRVDDQAELEVCDQGIGIPPDEQARLFQPFARGTAAMRGIPGTGLGLYVTAQIVDRHEGSIRVRSASGEGSCFTVTLPLAMSEH